ncbi:MAG TPA: hypothetical protein VEV83_06475 [Parafilimonas sp.]|nr:hypothetical protein [Parafilimonas sp.]
MKRIASVFYLCTTGLILLACTKSSTSQPPPPPPDTILINLSHLNYLYTPLTFPNGVNAAGIYIYSEAPDYHLVEASGEGFSCVDDVSRATLVYIRSKNFSSDTSSQGKAINLVKFMLQMQSANGYFYNFLFTNGLINKAGATSVDNPNWWSWRALQALTEAYPRIKNIDPSLAAEMDASITKLVANIKRDFVPLPQTTKVVNGITVPEWLPAGSGTDQASLMIIGLISYYALHNDAVVKDYVKKLADGVALMQAGDGSNYPYGPFLSWEDTWHAYGNLQAYALMNASAFLNDETYKTKAFVEVDNFYPWLLQNGFQSSFSLSKSGSTYQTLSENDYDQIAYGIEPMFFAAAEAYKETLDDKYADIAGHIAAWLLGANDPAMNMYDTATGRCFDAIFSATGVNRNSGAESTIEALLTLQKVEEVPAIKTALDKYKK